MSHIFPLFFTLSLLSTAFWKDDLRFKGSAYFKIAEYKKKMFTVYPNFPLLQQSLQDHKLCTKEVGVRFKQESEINSVICATDTVRGQQVEFIAEENGYTSCLCLKGKPSKHFSNMSVLCLNYTFATSWMFLKIKKKEKLPPYLGPSFFQHGW